MGKEEFNIKGKALDINMIQKILPHRYPFLLVDRMLEMSDRRIVAIKNVTINEPFFEGHFPSSCSKTTIRSRVNKRWVA